MAKDTVSFEYSNLRLSHSGGGSAGHLKTISTKNWRKLLQNIDDKWKIAQKSHHATHSNKRAARPSEVRLKMYEKLSPGEFGEDFSLLNDTLSEYLFPAHDETSDTPAVQFDYKKHFDYRKLPMKSEETHKNMYSKFLNTKEVVAARWRKGDKKDFTGLDFDKKMSLKTREIASEFIDWMSTLGGDLKISVGVDEIETLFEIGFCSYASEALCMEVREMIAVPETVALTQGVPEMSYAALLYKQLYRDITSVKRREDRFAFGTMLPQEYRTGPKDNTEAYKWIENKRVPEKLATMAVVWEEIENLYSTIKYCEWLGTRPDIEAPKYLLDKGCIRYSKKPRKTWASFSSKISLRPISRVSSINPTFLNRPSIRENYYSNKKHSVFIAN